MVMFLINFDLVNQIELEKNYFFLLCWLSTDKFSSKTTFVLEDKHQRWSVLQSVHQSTIINYNLQIKLKNCSHELVCIYLHILQNRTIIDLINSLSLISVKSRNLKITQLARLASSEEKNFGLPPLRWLRSKNHLWIDFNDSFTVQKKHRMRFKEVRIMIQILPYNSFLWWQSRKQSRVGFPFLIADIWGI